MTARSTIPRFASACVIVLAACGGSTDSSAPVPGLETTIGSDVPDTIEPSETREPAGTSTEVPATDPPDIASPPSTDVPATDPSATAPPAPVTSAPTAATTVVYVGSSVGGAWAALATWDGFAWQEADFDDDGEALTPPPSDFATVSVASLGLAGPLTGLAYGPDDFVCVDDRTGPTLDLPAAVGEISAGMGYDVVATATDWDIQPRPVSQVGVDAVDYQTIGESFAAAGGVDGSVGDVVQVIRADLDGDGIDEVLVTFEKITVEGFGTVGDFSIVYLRHPNAAGDVVDSVVFEHYPAEPTDFPTMGEAGVIAVADLNGDAVMEVVLRSSYWETGLAELFSFTGGNLVEAAAAGCGL